MTNGNGETETDLPAYVSLLLTDENNFIKFEIADEIKLNKKSNILSFNTKETILSENPNKNENDLKRYKKVNMTSYPGALKWMKYIYFMV